jgi:proteasome inhibitor subunit 1 (PI31)
MHVGPGDPIFGPGRMGGGVGAPPGHGSLPPGARWDPIAPPGMQGFHPDDFQRPGGGRPHPDMAQPGPGRGTDMDYMFG